MVLQNICILEFSGFLTEREIEGFKFSEVLYYDDDFLRYIHFEQREDGI